MQPGISEIRFARGIDSNIVADAFELAAAYVLQVLALRGSSGGFVEINRYLKALPYLLTHMAGHGDAICNAYAFNRNEWHNIRSSQPRMRALMFIQIDQLCSFAHSANRRLLHRIPLTGQRDHAAIVVRIHFPVEQVDAIHLHGFNDRVYFRFVASFRKIRDAFHQSLHKPEAYRAGNQAASRQGEPKAVNQYPAVAARLLTRSLRALAMRSP